MAGDFILKKLKTGACNRGDPGWGKWRGVKTAPLYLEKQALVLHTLLPGMIPAVNVHSACGCRKYVAEEPGQERVREGRQT